MASIPAATDHPLLRPLRALAGQARRLVWMAGLARTLSAALAALVAVALLDAWTRPAGAVYPWAAFAVVLVVVGVAFWRWLWPALCSRIDVLAVARRVQRLNPQLGDRLVAAVGLLTAGDGGGSRQLRSAAIDQAAEGLEGVDFRTALDRRPAARALLLLVVSMAAAVLFAAAAPEVAQRAVLRSVAPWRGLGWPRAHELALVDLPRVVPSGSDVVVRVADARGTLPDDVAIELQGFDHERLSVRHAPGASSGRAVVADVRRDFRIRAVGGDDFRMPWHRVHVVDAPGVVDASVRLTPPEYTELPSRVPRNRQVRVLSGTRLDLQATLSRPVESAALVALEDSPAAQYPARLDAEGAVVEVAGVPLERSGRYALRVTDRTGLEMPSGWRLSVEVVPDQEPQLRWVEPTEDSMLLSTGSIALAWKAIDDLRVRESGVELSRSDAGSDARPQRLWWRGVGSGEAATIERRELLELATLPGVQPGTVLSLRAVATDSAGQTGRSAVRRLTIVTAEVLQEEAMRLRRQATESLREAAGRVRLAAEQTEAGAVRLREQPDERQPAADRLRAARARLRTVADGLAAEQGASAAAQLREAADRLNSSRLDPDAAAEFLRAAEQLEELAAEGLGPASDQLRELAARVEAEDAESLAQTILQAADAQSRIASRIEQAARELARDETLRQAATELGDLLGQQQRLTDRVAQASDGGPEAGREAARQRELARRLEEIVERLNQEDEGEASPATRALAREAADMLEASGAASDMRTAADAVSEGRTAEAENAQRRAARAMAEARDALVGRDSEARARAMVRGLRQASERLEQLQVSQQALAERLRSEPPSAGEPSAAEALAEGAAALAEQLDQMAAPSAADAVREAAQADRTAAERLQAGRREGAGEAAEAAAESLAAAEQELQRRRDQASREQQTTQLDDLARRVQGLREQQQRVVAALETLSLPAEASTTALGRDESELARATRALVPRARPLAGFAPVLELAADDLEAAAAGLARGRAGQAVIERADDARMRLGQVAEALRQGADEDARTAEQAPSEPADPEAAEPDPPGPSVASLHLLRSMQAWVRERTGRLGAQRPDSDPQARERWQRARGRLADEQRALAELVRQWTRQQTDANEPPEV